LLAQLAVGGLRVITPSALSTPAIATRYLVQSGASTPDALTTVGVRNPPSWSRRCWSWRGWRRVRQ
jgi:hypothetical protein